MVSLSLLAQAVDPADLLVKKLEAQFVPTVFDQNETDIVTSGTVVALKMDGHISNYIQDPNKPRNGLVVFRLPLKYCPITTYKKGTLSMGFGDSSDVAHGDDLNINEFFSYPGKYLQIGERFWIRSFGIANKKDAILAIIVTDPYEDGRYCGMLKFPFEKGHLPTADDALKMISEVLAVQQAQEPEAKPEPVAPLSSPPAPAARQYDDVAPPPAPPAPAPTITIGERKAQVLTDFGEPQRKAATGPKEIYFYTDLKMKVTFVNGKVSSID
jgi:hypothetical protein